MNVIRFLPLACLAGLLALPAHAEPRSIDDCEKIQAPDAYNQCLASFGPVAKEHNLRPADAAKTPVATSATAKGADVTASSQTAKQDEPRAKRGRHGGYRGRHSYRGRSYRGGGRHRMSFTVGHRHHR